MKNLLYLYLSDNDLTFLDSGAFAGAPELTYLHLEGNRLAQFPGSGQWLVKSNQAVCKFMLQEFTKYICMLKKQLKHIFSVSLCLSCSSGTLTKSVCVTPGAKCHL